jgi:hypothetical protein
MLAERVRGMTTLIDLVARDSQGNVLIVLIGEEGEAAALLTRALAHRAWLEPRLRDWAQLAPQLDLAPDATVRALLLAPGFDGETRLAAESLTARIVDLATWRYLENEQQRAVLLERVSAEGESASTRVTDAPSNARPAPLFRSGLSESDLGLSPEELHELE